MAGVPNKVNFVLEYLASQTRLNFVVEYIA